MDLGQGRRGVDMGPSAIRYARLQAVLEELGYASYVGLEYSPTTQRTEESFAWIPEALRGSDMDVRELKL